MCGVGLYLVCDNFPCIGAHLEWANYKQEHDIHNFTVLMCVPMYIQSLTVFLVEKQN